MEVYVITAITAVAFIAFAVYLIVYGTKLVIPPGVQHRAELHGVQIIIIYEDESWATLLNTRLTLISVAEVLSEHESTYRHETGHRWDTKKYPKDLYVVYTRKDMEYHGYQSYVKARIGPKSFPALYLHAKFLAPARVPDTEHVGDVNGAYALGSLIAHEGTHLHGSLAHADPNSRHDDNRLWIGALMSWGSLQGVAVDTKDTFEGRTLIRIHGVLDAASTRTSIEA